MAIRPASPALSRAIRHRELSTEQEVAFRTVRDLAEALGRCERPSQLADLVGELQALLTAVEAREAELDAIEAQMRADAAQPGGGQPK
jgi:hypothetical protein